VEAAAALSFGKCGPGQSTPPTVLTTPDTGYSVSNYQYHRFGFGIDFEVGHANRRRFDSFLE